MPQNLIERYFFGLATNTDTMLPYKEPRLKRRGCDLKKRWYVEYYVTKMPENTLVRRVVYIETKYNTVALRTKRGKDIVARVSELLRRGYHITEPSEPLTAKNLTETLAEIVTKYKATFRPDTIRSYQSAIKILGYFLEHVQKSNIQANEFRPEHINELIGYLLNVRKNTPRTANNILTNLKTLFNYLLREKVLKTNPIERKKLPYPETINLPFSEAQRLLISEHLKTHNYNLFLFTQCMYFAFLRRTELTKIKIENIDFERNVFRLSGAISKNKKAETIPIHPNLKSLLLPFAVFPANYYLFGHKLNPSPKPVAIRSINWKHQKALEAVGIDKSKYTLYTWKDTGIVNAYTAGVDIMKLKALVRHRSLEILQIYLNSLGLINNTININW